MAKTKILFLCTGNSARSQMAEAFLRKYAGERFEAYSAGLEPKEIHPFTRRVMVEVGLDLKGQYAKSVSEYLGKLSFGYLVTVCDKGEKNCPTTFPGVGQRVHWDLKDPAAFSGPETEALNKFRAVRDQIEAQVRAWLAEQGVPAAGNRVSA
jgi:arsenate reductase